MILDYSFTKEDQELIGQLSVRDPLGTQIIWGALGRKIVPHLTEQTNSVMGFQLLLSTFYFYEKYETIFNNNWKESKERLKNKNVRFTMSLQNVFILFEQAFAFSYFTFKKDWPLYGKRQVICMQNDEIYLSLKRQILSSQLATGIWGYYRGAAIRAGLINESGDRLIPSIFDVMDKDEKHIALIKKNIIDKIKDGLVDGEVNFPCNKKGMNKLFHDILSELPQKEILKKYLLPQDLSSVRELAKYAYEQKYFKSEPNNKRAFIHDCVRKYPSQSDGFKNLIYCTDYAGTLDSIFEWLTCLNGKSLDTVAKMLKVNLTALNKSKQLFTGISTFPKGTTEGRVRLFLDIIDLTSKRSLIKSLIELHKEISKSRGAKTWIVLSDSEKIIVESEPFMNIDSAPTVSPGFGWRYDFYLTPLLNIYGGFVK